MATLLISAYLTIIISLAVQNLAVLKAGEY